MPQNNRVFAWRRDDHDPRDHVFGATAVQPLFAPAPVVLEPIVDLEPKFQPVYDQLNLGSCVYNACGGLYEYLLRIEGKPSYTPSRLFGYWNGRNMDGTVNQDSGSTLRTGMKVLAQIGAPDETFWPYNTSQFRTQPPQSVFAAATPHKATAYQRLNQTLSHLRMCLHMGFPFVFGIDCYPELQSAQVARTGIVPMPRPGAQSVGGHALLMVGYNVNTSLFKFRNSWSAGWGARGYGYLPFAYVLGQNASDFWTAQVAA